MPDQGLDLDVRLQPIALTLPQVKGYRLPRTPIKPSERRRASFENRFCRGAVELDALEALYPGKLAGITESAILDYYDEDMDAETRCWLSLHHGHSLEPPETPGASFFGDTPLHPEMEASIFTSVLELK